jgi:hypothetical protein
MKFKNPTRHGLIAHSKGFWRWCVTLITTRLLDFVNRPDFHKPENTMFQKLDLFPSSGEGGHLLYRNQKLALPQAMSEQKKVNHSKQGN